MNNPKRNHHVTPKLYLKGFVTKAGDPHIWVYERGKPYNPGNDKIKNNPYSDLIKNAGVERDFYADPKEDGTQDFETFENKLESLEKPADSIFQKLRARQLICDDEKLAFATYIILMYRRVASAREKIKERLAKETYEPTVELFQKANLPDTPETRAELKKIAERLAQKPGYDIQTHNRITAATPDSFLIEVLQKMTWNFYVSTANHAYLTNDNPVFISDKFGLGKNISELSFPISTDVALVASWNKTTKGGFSEAAPQYLKELNRRTISKASKYVYFAKKEEWVVTILNENKYEYRPMYSVKSVCDVVKLETYGGKSKPDLIWNKIT